MDNVPSTARRVWPILKRAIGTLVFSIVASAATLAVLARLPEFAVEVEKYRQTYFVILIAVWLVPGWKAIPFVRVVLGWGMVALIIVGGLWAFIRFIRWMWDTPLFS